MNTYQHQCVKCGKNLSCYKSLWRHKRNGICQRFCGFDSNVSDSIVGQKRKADGKYVSLFTNRSPSLASPSWTKKPRTKADIVGYNDDETQGTLKPVKL